MENIIKKAIEGGYNGYPKPFCIECGNYEAPSENTKSNNMFLDPLFWQALGKACGWKENTFYGVVCCVGEGEEYWFGSDTKNEKSDWLKYSIYFHEINLTEGWDKAVEYLENLINQ